jgi:hypothetical protein
MGVGSLVEGPDELVEYVTARSIHIGISLAAREIYHRSRA